MFRACCIALCLIAVGCGRAPPDEAAPASQPGRAPAIPDDSSQARDDRTAVVELVRAAATADLGTEVTLDVRRFAVSDRWAFLTATPRTPQGAPIEYGKTRYADLIEEGMFDDGLCALAERRDGSWALVRMDIGATDVPYEAWPEKYGVPRELLFGE